MTYQGMDDMHKKEHCCCSGISWKAIFAGAFVAIGLSFLLNAFGAAIGLSAFTIVDNVTTVAIGGFIAMLFAGIVSMFVAGWVAGFLNRACCREHCTGALAGFLSWCVALVFAGLLAAHLGQLININISGTNVASSANRLSPGILGDMTTSNNKEHSASSKASESKSSRSSEATTSVSEEKMLGNVGKALFFTFLLFFFGALASTFGGHCGMKGCKKSEMKNRD